MTRDPIARKNKAIRTQKELDEREKQEDPIDSDYGDTFSDAGADDEEDDPHGTTKRKKQ